jgi:proline racemase/trans-L-3-hydroxyproline dehydratase
VNPPAQHRDHGSGAAGAVITTVDYHTGGEPFRIVTGGVGEIPGAGVLARRAAAMERFDDVRRLLCHEPRGHADMYGCFLVPPDDPGAHFGALFWHKDGFSTACGHGTIALGAYAVQEGLVQAAPDGETDVVVDVPSGRVTARVRMSAGRVRAVTFVNVPSYVIARDVAAGGVKADLAYGGAIYASVPAAALGLSVEPRHLTALIEHARRIKAGLATHPAARHPSDERLSGVYGVIFHDELPDVDGMAHQRNVTVFADGEVDRSPCGSGTAARLALLHDSGLRGPLLHAGIVGSVFRARVAEVRAEGIVPEIEGMAYRTGRHAFELDPDDPIGTGFTLR